MKNSHWLARAVMLIAGGLLGASTFMWFLAPLAPLLLAVFLISTRDAMLREALNRGMYFGFGLLASALSWGFTALPLNWLGITDPYLGFGIIFFIWCIYSVILALPIAGIAFGIRAFREWFLLLLPCIWVLGEWVRAFLFSLATWGSGTTIGADFSFGFVGYALSWIPGTLHLARFGGVYSLSFVCVSAAVALFFFYQRTSIRSVCIGLVGYVLIVGVLIFMPSPIRIQYEPSPVEVKGLRISPISTAFEPTLVRGGFHALDKSLVTAGHIYDAASIADVIILPEYSNYLKTEELLPTQEAARVRAALRTYDVLLIDSERSADDQSGSILFYEGGRGSVLATKHKRFLIPLGEYMPEPLIVLARFIGLSDEIDAVLRARSYTPSREPFSSRIVEWHGVRLGVLACSETFSPFGYKQVADAGADVLINIASHSWVRGSAPILFNETMAMARVHAVHTGKPYIQASNYSPSFAIFPR